MQFIKITALIFLFVYIPCAQNLVKNGDFFNSGTHWTLGDYNNVAECRVINGEYRISVSSPQQEEWAVQLMQKEDGGTRLTALCLHQECIS